jgi:inhibitor of KinA sporulation pathway (predicted exonuclease)
LPTLVGSLPSSTRPGLAPGPQFTRQCLATGTTYPFGHRHTNAKLVFTEAHGLRKRPGMAQALQVAGLPLEGRHHSGEDDAWNIAALILGLAARGAWPTWVE